MPGGRRKPLFGAGVAVLVILLLAWTRVWPFDSAPEEIEGIASPSVWQYLFSDRFTLGYARLAVVFAALFVIASVTALALAGRWMSGFGGLSVDEKEGAGERISALEERLTLTQAQLDEEAAKRREAEDWADALIDDLDQANIQLAQAEVEEGLEEDDDHGQDPGGDSGPAGSPAG